MMPAYYLEVMVVVLGLGLLLADAFVEGSDKRWLGIAGILGLAVVFGLNFVARGGEGGFWNYYTYGAGSFAGFYKGLALLATILVLVMSREYLPVVRDYTAERHAGGEFLVLPLFTCAGLMWAASAVDLVSIFVSIELVTVSFYVLVAYMRRNTGSLEAGVKYLILSALSTGFLVYGIAWIVGMTGETNLEALAREVLERPAKEAGLLFGFTLLLVGLGFKVGAFPFCVWIPDVYQGAPTPTTAFLSVGSKAAGFIVLMRVLEPFMNTAATLSHRVATVVTVISAATLLFGALVALLQTNFKRLLAYSSIAQAGFLLLAISCSPLVKDPGAILSPRTVVSFHLASYLMMAMLAFLVVALVRRHLGGEELKTFQGLGKRSPFVAFSLLVAMVSLAGVPLTAGFFGKFFIFQLAVEAKAWWPLGVAVLAAVCGFYYYLKVVRAMYLAEPEPGQEGPIPVSGFTKGVMLLLVVGILGFGVNPGPLLNRPVGSSSSAEPAAVQDSAKPPAGPES